ncbi:hypothetical protein [Planctomicrobium sp. SH664]|uniref:hypothetical protein n=1 Tax=Planctomicrobium sp. SH664 TaxID=3448125 RepID=UPI003F5BD5BE
MSRKHRGEMEFGSDSFLDVVANIVGILIVLVVCAGIRAEQGPAPEVVAVMTEQVLEKQASAPAPVVMRPAAEPAQAVDKPIIPDVPEIPEELPELPPLPTSEPPRVLVEEAEKLRRQNEELAAQLLLLEQQSQQVSQAHATESRSVEELKQRISEKVQLLKSMRARLRTAAATAETREGELVRIQRAIDETENEPGPTEKLTHRLPPIGRVVTGNEVHFRVEKNRVSHVPVKELAEDVSRDIERRKEILLTRPFFQGSTSPVKGYSMEYVLQRMPMSFADEMRHGRGMVRIGVSGWVIKPERNVVTESVEEALAPGSRFQAALLSEGPTATVTFWVYPDSFEAHRQLKNAVHDAGLWVASRPLPEGIPIAGSPDGSKSMAQ